ncbi:MAG TPA: pitrilysin family protein [Thermoanaerobaculia bacterium]|jgi:zinc protease|nr:pitrilysin family protein [Thermoanaerobaculia bacterium]
MRRPLILSALLLTISANAATAATTPLDPFLSSVKRRTLPNGLTVITREAPGTGVVAVNTWVKAGYFHEPDEVAGMAHLFEHMLFKSSKNFPRVEQVAEEIASVGGSLNAGTIYDTTNYYFVVPKEGFRRALELQVDAIANPIFDAAELKKEAEVVIEESNRKRDNPPAMASELMYATAFEKHRIRRWRIGSNDVLRNVKRDDLVAFFETLYQPQNMILVVSGDINHDEAAKAIDATFGKMKKGTLAKKGGPAEPPQTAFRYGQQAADVRQGYTTMGWHTPGVGHRDGAAIDALALILGGGRSSRFFRNVIGPEGAATANANNQTFEDVGLFEVQASFDEKNRAEVDRRLLREIERIKAHGPSAFELQLAKNLAESQTILGLQNVLGQANALGYNEVRGGYRGLGTNLAEMMALAPADITRVARQYLTVDNMTMYHYRAKGTPELTRDQALASVKEAVSAAPEALEAASNTVTSTPARAARGTRAPEVSKLSNGATLIVEERAGAPAVTVAVYFAGGRNEETSANAGITRLMTSAMRRGTTSRGAEQIDREIEFLGTQIGTDMARDYFGFDVDVVSRNVRPATALLADVVLAPTFPEKGVTEEKHLQKAAIRRTADSAGARPQALMYEALYRNHPYALTAEGYVTSVDATDAAALRAWWQQHVNADDALIVIAGDLHADDAKQIAEEAFAKLPKRTTPRATTALPLAANGRSDVIEYRDRKQSAIALGFPAVGYTHPDYAPLRLLQQVTSGISGTLFSELRGKRSLAYTVFSTIASADQGGTYYAYMATDAAKEEEARKGLLGELRRHSADAVTEENLARAKSSLAGQTRLQRQTNEAHVAELARGHYLNLGLDFSERFLAAAQSQTLDAVRKAAGKYLAGDNYVLAIMRGKQ